MFKSLELNESDGWHEMVDNFGIFWKKIKTHRKSIFYMIQ
jgi:hypothetical protein